jgi:lipoate-protein ligase A
VIRRVHWIDSRFPGRPALDTAFSRALLDLVAAGEAPETFRLYRPDDVVAFSGMDAAQPGFASAAAAARRAGFDAALRLAGGRAAVFHRQTLAFAWTLPAPETRDGIRARFDEAAAIFADALRSLGVDARVGEVAGEYCPGEHSVNARGARKLMGVGQRVIRGAAHVGGVLVVNDAERVRAALGPVYAAMEFAWDPATTGSVADEIGAVTLEDVGAAIEAAFAARFDLAPGGVPVERVREAAAALESRFGIEGGGATPPRALGKTAHEDGD